MTKLKEDQSGWDGEFVKKIDDKSSMLGMLTNGASKLTGDFAKYKKDYLDKLKKEKEAEAKAAQKAKDAAKAKADKEAQAELDKDKKEAAKREKRLARLAQAREDARQQRKIIRDEKEAEERAEAKAKADRLAQKVKDGHILPENYKYKYRELLLTNSALTIVDLYEAGKIDVTVLPKMFKYGKSIETMFQRYPGTLVSSIRQGKFYRHKGMQKLIGNSEVGSKSDGPYKIIHPMFSPKDLDRDSELKIRRMLMNDYARDHLFRDSFSSPTTGDDVVSGFGFSGASSANHFNQILKATGVGGIDHIVIGWYFRTYHHVIEGGKTIHGAEDPKRSMHTASLTAEDNTYINDLENSFPIQFFTEFSGLFELVLMENLRLYNLIDDLIRRAGMIHDTDTDNTSTNNDSEGDYWADAMEK